MKGAGEMLLISDKNTFIKQHIPFIIKTVSQITGQYVTLNQDEMSIALLAFNEAIDKYKEDRGEFLPFAKVVIRSRVLNYLEKEQKRVEDTSLDVLEQKVIELIQPIGRKESLKEEIESLEQQLKPFGIELETLADEGPKHQDTRKKAISISHHIQKHELILMKMYEKFRLPIRMISTEFHVTEKFIKRSKKFIVTVVIILDKNYQTLIEWIGGDFNDL